LMKKACPTIVFFVVHESVLDAVEVVEVIATARFRPHRPMTFAVRSEELRQMVTTLRGPRSPRSRCSARACRGPVGAPARAAIAVATQMAGDKVTHGEQVAALNHAYDAIVRTLEAAIMTKTEPCVRVEGPKLEGEACGMGEGHRGSAEFAPPAA
jgi:hypothetical protein